MPVTTKGRALDAHEALALALYVEDACFLDTIRKLPGGWACLGQMAGGDNMRMFLFARTDEGRTEYVLANKGTDYRAPWDHWNNMAQLFGMSRDMQASMRFASAFVKAHPHCPVTFIGHSKGGAEAAANAIATNRSAIVLNPMRLTLNGALAKRLAHYQGSVDVIAVDKDPLRRVFGWPQAIPGTYLVVPSLTATPHRLSAIEYGLTHVGILGSIAGANMI